jgi:hypothetical protein
LATASPSMAHVASAMEGTSPAPAPAAGAVVPPLPRPPAAAETGWHP